MYRNSLINLAPPIVHSIGCKNGLNILLPFAPTIGIVTLLRSPLQVVTTE